MSFIERVPGSPNLYRPVLADVTGAVTGNTVIKAASGEWIPGTVSGSGEPLSLGALTDVNTSGETEGMSLMFDGTQWVPQLVDVPTEHHEVGAAALEHQHLMEDITDLEAEMATKASVAAFNAEVAAREALATAVAGKLDATALPPVTASVAALDTRLDIVEADQAAMESVVAGIQALDTTQNARLTSAESSVINLQARMTTQENRVIPDSPDDIGAAAVNHTHTTAQVTGLDASIAAMLTRLTNLEARPLAPIYRNAVVTLPAVALLATVEVTVTWPTAMPNANYMITYSPELPAGHIGQLSFNIKQGSITAASCVIQMRTALALSASQGKLHLRAEAL